MIPPKHGFTSRQGAGISSEIETSYAARQAAASGRQGAGISSEIETYLQASAPWVVSCRQGAGISSEIET